MQDTADFLHKLFIENRISSLMVKLTNNHKVILYSVGLCLRQLNLRFQDKPLEMAVPKIAFIEVLEESPLVSKKERALYKNLETLERKKLLSYDGRQLSLTLKGLNLFKKLENELAPFEKAKEFWSSDLQMKRKLQTVIKN